MKTTLKKTFKGFDFFDQDQLNKCKKIPVNAVVEAKLNVKDSVRSYKHLKFYKSAINFMAENPINDQLDKEDTVDLYLKIKCGFTKNKIIVDIPCKNCGHVKQSVYFVPESLSYSTCSHERACNYITDALELIVAKMGFQDVAELRQKIIEFKGK